MTVLWAVLGSAAGLVAAAMTYVGVRDRRRLTSRDDQAANRDAIAQAERFAAGRHGPQGLRPINDQMHGNG